METSTGRELSTDRLLAIIAAQREIVAAGLDLDVVMQIVVERAATLTSAAGAVIEWIDGDELVYRVGVGITMRMLGLRIARSGSLSGLCVERGEALGSDDVDDDPRVDPVACRTVGIGSMVCLPLVHHGSAVGVLKVVSQEKHAFDEEATVVLTFLRDVVSAAIAYSSAFAQKERESRSDALTGLPNRRAYDEELVHEVARARRYSEPLTLVLLDLDGFKLANDGFGHPYGDEVLRKSAEILVRSTRASDRTFRIGGDEFAILMCGTALDASKEVVTRCATAIRAARFAGGVVGISAGAAELEGDDVIGLQARADEMLYVSKRASKEREAPRAESVVHAEAPRAEAVVALAESDGPDREAR